MKNKQTNTINADIEITQSEGIATQESASVQHQKRHYTTPRLTCYGDVRDITLGPTIGVGESGNELQRRP